MIRWCGVAGCMAITVITDGAKRTNNCAAHTGMDQDDDTDDERIARVCAAMNWRRVRPR